MITAEHERPAEVRRPEPALRPRLQGRRRGRADVADAQPGERAPRALLPADRAARSPRSGGGTASGRPRRALAADAEDVRRRDRRCRSTRRATWRARGPAGGPRRSSPTTCTNRADDAGAARLPLLRLRRRDRRLERGLAREDHPRRVRPVRRPRAAARSRRSRSCRPRSSCATRTARRRPRSRSRSSRGCTVQINGSASEDPENKRLTFKWSVDGVALAGEPAGPRGRADHRPARPPHVQARGLRSRRPAGHTRHPVPTVC